MSRPLRVLFAIGTMSGGGAERVLLEILRHLDRSRFTPLLYLIHRRGELLDDIPGDVPVFAFEERVRSPRLYFPGRIHRLQVLDFEQILREQRIDVVYDRTWFMTLIAAPASRRAGTPRVSVIDCNPEHDLKTSAGRFQFLKRRLLRRAYAHANRVIAVSESLQQEVLRFYRLPARQVIALPNGIDLELIDRRQTDETVKLEPDRFHIVAVGRIQEQKGFNYLLETMNMLVHARNMKQQCLHILGDGRQRQELEEFVRAKRLNDFVCFHGFVGNPFPYYRAADLFCLSSLYEGLPTVILEALACRLPVLSTDCPTGPREILANGKFGRLVPPGDSAALADAIADAVTDPAPWHTQVDLAREHVERNYSIQVTIARLETLLMEIGGQ